MEVNHLILWSFMVVVLFFFFFFQSRSSRKSAVVTSKLPPGRSGWSLIGDSIKLYHALSSSHPPSFVEEQVKRLFGRKAVMSADPFFNRFVMQNEGKLFRSSYPKSFRDLVGKNGVIVVQGEQQRRLHGIAVNMMRLERLNSYFLGGVENVILQTLDSFHDGEVILLQDVCRKVAINLMINQLLGVSTESEINEMACLFSNFADGCLSNPVNLPGFTYHRAMKKCPLRNDFFIFLEKGQITGCRTGL